jgi:hypothetical protein
MLYLHGKGIFILVLALTTCEIMADFGIDTVKSGERSQQSDRRQAGLAIECTSNPTGGRPLISNPLK